MALQHFHQPLYSITNVHSLRIEVEVFHAVAATAENGEDGPYYLAVLIAYQLTAKSQVGVDYRGKNTVKSVQNEKYSAKSADFLRFLLYLFSINSKKIAPPR